MDKNSSLRCLKFSLIAGNSAVIALGLAGFITGLVAPNAMAHLGVSGSQLALVSSIAVVIAAAGLIGALREHFCLLLTYAFSILSVFIFRLVWSLTSPLHQSGRFVMDTTVSLTLLSSLAKLFLMIFAFLLALGSQNSLPLTKQKFLQLKDKFKWRDRKNKSKDTIDSGQMKKRHIKTISQSSMKPTKALKSHHYDPNGIYISSNHNIYESGRRRSPSSRMMNGHHHSGHGHHSGSGRSSRRYQSGVGYSGPISPNESAHSSASQDSNNNNTRHQNGGSKLLNNELAMSPPPTNINHHLQHQHHHPSHKNQSQSLPRVPAPRRGQKIYSSSSDYIHYRSPSPPSKIVTEVPVQEKTKNKFTNQPFFNPYRSLPKTSSNTLPATTITMTSTSKILPINHNRFEQRSSTPTTTDSMPRSSLYTPTYTSPSKSNHASSSSQPIRPKTLSTKWNAPTYSSRLATGEDTPTTTITIDTITSPTISSRLYSSSPNIIPATSSNPKINGQVVTTASSSTLTAPVYSSSYQFDSTNKLFDSSYPPKTTGISTNLSQTRNLFSTYTSPYSSRLSSTPPPLSVPNVSEDQSQLSSSNKEKKLFSPTPAYRSYRSTTPTTKTTASYLYSTLKSPEPSPTTHHRYQYSSSPSPANLTNTSNYHWSRTPTPPVVTTTSSSSTTSTNRYLSSKLFSTPSNTSTATTATTTKTTSSLFDTPSYSRTTPSSSATLTYPHGTYGSYLSSIPKTSTTATTSTTTTTTTTTSSLSTISNDKYRFFYSANTTTPDPATTTTGSSSSNLFSRVYPKTYEEYVKSYRYPESSSSPLSQTMPLSPTPRTSLSTTAATTKTSNYLRPIEGDNTLVTIDSTSLPNENVFVVTGYNRTSSSSAAGNSSADTKSSIAGLKPIGTVMETLATQEIKDETSQHQKRMIFYKKQHTLFHET